MRIVAHAWRTGGTPAVKAYLRKALTNWRAARQVASAGNEVELDGCRFDVSSPVVPPAVKRPLLAGSYEMGERAAVAKHLDPGLPVVELGGSLGVVACCTNRRLADPTRHVVVEADPRLIPLLERNKALNGARFAIQHAALAYGQAEVDFCVAASTLAGHLGTPDHQTLATVRVPTTTLQRVLDDAGFVEAQLICDIEGAEADLVRQELQVLREHVVTILIETGALSEPGTRALVDAVNGVGFRLVDTVLPDTPWPCLVLKNSSLIRSQGTLAGKARPHTAERVCGRPDHGRESTV